MHWVLRSVMRRMDMTRSTVATVERRSKRRRRWLHLLFEDEVAAAASRPVNWLLFVDRPQGTEQGRWQQADYATSYKKVLAERLMATIEKPGSWPGFLERT
ncbi:hypothetical protein [Ectopseudomonas mendocina]|uniref:hypothetical protein n=1 Tax=Ectopseudomonas mendocina TaxID=300 RepID=UPI003132F0A8